MWLQSPRIKEKIWLNAVQSAQPNLSMWSLGSFPTPIPTLDEQAAIVQGIAAEQSIPDTIINRTEREIALLREYRNRLIADVVTGKLDVREAARCLPEEIEEPVSAEPGDDLTDEAAIEDDLPEEVA